MPTTDKCCTIVPYFKIPEDKLSQFKELCNKFIEATNKESKCLFYGFSFNGNIAHCREGYQDASGVLEHLDNVGSLLQDALQISELVKLEIHGPKDELSQLRIPLAELNPEFFVLECGFRR